MDSLGRWLLADGRRRIVRMIFGHGRDVRAVVTAVVEKAKPLANRSLASITYAGSKSLDEEARNQMIAVLNAVKGRA